MRRMKRNRMKKMKSDWNMVLLRIQQTQKNRLIYLISDKLQQKYWDQFMKNRQNLVEKELEEELRAQIARFNGRVYEFPLKIRYFLKTLSSLAQPFAQPESAAEKSIHGTHLFSASFLKQSLAQRLYFTRQCIRNADILVQKAKGAPCSIEQSTVQEIDTVCFIKKSLLKWEHCEFKLLADLFLVKLKISRKEYLLDLQKYHVRRANKDKLTLVFDLIIENSSEKYNKWYIQFTNQPLFQAVHSRLTECMLAKCTKEMAALLANKSEFVMVLTQKHLNEFLLKKKSLLQQLQSTEMKVVHDVSGVKVCANRQGFQYRMSVYLEKGLEAAKKYVTVINRKPVGRLLRYELIDRFSPNITSGYFQYDLKNKLFDSLCIVEDITRGNQHETTLFGVNNCVVVNNLVCLFVLLDNFAKGKTLVTVFMQVMNYGQTWRQEMHATDFLTSLVLKEDDFKESNSPLKHPNQQRRPNQRSEFNIESDDGGTKDKLNKIFQFQKEEYAELQEYEVLNLSNFQQIKSLKQIFFSVADHSFNGARSQEYVIDSDSGDENQMNKSPQQTQFFKGRESDLSTQVLELEPINYAQQNLKERENINISIPSYLHVPAFNQPRPKGIPNLMPANHKTLEWKRGTRGGLVCIDEAIISEQKKIFKHFLIRMGNQIFKNRGIMNISLPVQIFKKESHLVGIARNFIYAPHFMETTDLKEPFARIKNTILLLLSMNIEVLAMQKPFNPILGETFQGSIDGCPISLEQISHHPPISSIFFKGRGYTITGNVEAQVSIGMNCARGQSFYLWTVQFNDGSQVIFSSPRMVINGMLFGERTFNFDGTCFVIDRTNLLIAEVIFGAKKSPNKQKNQHMSDYFEGKTYKVDEKLMGQFRVNQSPLPSKDQNSREVFSFHGFWNQFVEMDGKRVLDFTNQMPFRLESCESQLPSNCWDRLDVVNLIEGNIEQAQNEKDILEEMQRKDQKLRNNHKNRKF